MLLSSLVNKAHDSIFRAYYLNKVNWYKLLRECEVRGHPADSVDGDKLDQSLGLEPKGAVRPVKTGVRPWVHFWIRAQHLRGKGLLSPS